GAWGNAIETDTLNFFRIIDCCNPWSQRRLGGDECTETFAKRHFCHGAEIIGSHSATQTARCDNLQHAKHREWPQPSPRPSLPGIHRIPTTLSCVMRCQ